jgi:hypothetical protein
VTRTRHPERRAFRGQILHGREDAAHPPGHFFEQVNTFTLPE